MDTVEIVKAYCREQRVPKGMEKRICQAVERRDYSELDRSELFTVFDALGLSQRDAQQEFLYRYVGNLWKERTLARA